MPTFAYGAATIAIILGFKIFLPKVPGAIIAVVGLLTIATVTDASSYGVDVVGAIQGGLPPIGFPTGLTWGDVPAVVSTAFACFVLIIAQSAATSRSFAMKHGDRADVNRDIVGLAASNLAAGFTGTFVVNGSPTKTQILDEQRGRTQVANITVVIITLIVLLFLTDLLTDLPKAVLGGIVLLIGIDLIDVKGFARILRRRPVEFVIALLTALTVFLVGVTAAVVLALLLSLLNVISRQYKARDFVLGIRKDGGYAYAQAAPGQQSEPGLIVFRYEADLFFANASRFADDVESVVGGAPDKPTWVILDCSAIADIDYSAGQVLSGLLDYLDSEGVQLILARPGTDLLETLTRYRLRPRISDDHIYADLDGAIDAFPRGGASQSP